MGPGWGHGHGARTVFLMKTSLELVLGTEYVVVCMVEGGHRAQKRPGKLGEGMEESPLDSNADEDGYQRGQE